MSSSVTASRARNCLVRYLSPFDYKVTFGNVGPNQEPADHTLTLIATELLLMVYYVVIVITLLNLMMSLLVERAAEALVS